MRLTQIQKQIRTAAPTPIDLRTPSGKALPW